MFLTVALLISVAVLSLLSGVAIYLGAHRDDRQRALAFLLASLLATVWIICLIFAPIHSAPLTALPLLSLVAIAASLTAKTIKTPKRKLFRLGRKIILAATASAGAVIVLTDLILPLNDNFDFLPFGPFAFGLALLAVLYAILRFRLLNVSARSLRFLSAASLVIVGVDLYMLIFVTVLTSLFKIVTPGAEVLALNFIMIIITLILLPILGEAYAYLRSLITTNEVHLTYIVKKLNRLAATNVKLNELATFLADHLHFSYIGLVVNERLSGSAPLSVPSSDWAKLSKLEHKPRSIWLAPDEEAQALYDRLNLTAVAELRNGKGKTFGLILVGKPLGKTKIDRRDLIQIEMIINLVATIVDSERRPKAR